MKSTDQRGKSQKWVYKAKRGFENRAFRTKYRIRKKINWNKLQWRDTMEGSKENKG